VTAEHQLQTAQAALAEAQARAEQLTVRATSAGRLAWPHAADLPGRFVARGALLAHVITGEPGLVRVAIAHEHAAQLRAHPGPVAVRTADALAPTRSGQWSGRTSGAGALLPSAALGEASGGSIATDPADAQGLRPARPVVLADVPLQGAPLTRIGERAWVRFEHGHAPLAWQALRAVQQQVLGHFNPGA
jgi:putative peptide zinc metalloprotease protein